MHDVADDDKRKRILQRAAGKEHEICDTDYHARNGVRDEGDGIYREFAAARQ